MAVVDSLVCLMILNSVSVRMSPAFWPGALGFLWLMALIGSAVGEEALVRLTRQIPAALVAAVGLIVLVGL